MKANAFWTYNHGVNRKSVDSHRFAFNYYATQFLQCSYPVVIAQ